MGAAYQLTLELRKKLKEPLGVLIRGSFSETSNRFKDLMLQENPPCVITVGDTVSRNFVEHGVFPKIVIIDNLAMRRATRPLSSGADRTVNVQNPPATITDEAIRAIRSALESGWRTRIVVDGEEDLLTLVAVMDAPDDAYIVYGQPYEGIVAVKVTPSKKVEVAAILKAMEDSRKG